MSRSYKKTPRSGDTKDKFFKRYANRRLRHKPSDEEPLQNKSYKKDFCCYDICDYEEVGTSFEQFYHQCVRSWHRWRQYHNDPFPTREEAWKEYLKWYKRK
jgi:hypothetical protein